MAACACETSIGQLNLSRGVIPLLAASFVSTDALIAKALDKANADGMAKAGDAGWWHTASEGRCRVFKPFQGKVKTMATEDTPD